MKIKGRVKNLAPNSMLLVMAVAVLVAVPLRTYQLFNIIEPQTGFYAKYDWSVTVLYSLLAVSCVLLFAFSFLCGSIPKPQFKEKKSIGLGISSVLLTLSFLVDSVVQIDVFIQIYNLYSTSLVKGAAYFIKSGGVAAAVQSLFAVLTAVYFLIMSISYFNGKKFYESSRILAICPIVWGLCRIIQRFVVPISFKNVSELLLQMFMLSFMLIFFLSFARIASNVNSEKSSWVMFASGLSTALLAMTTAVPSVIVMIMGKSSMLYSQFSVTFADIFIALFIVIMLLDFMPVQSEIEMMKNGNIELVEENKEEAQEVK